ncbi:acyl-CoA dehydrogenase family protein, partial [Leclercia adecarboxylata]|uniref:acyl-CoA dehydrogenase family protein n=1 Tax=Leclercia adecarboxylata TaxID=83655 RepID=UPI00234D0036
RYNSFPGELVPIFKRSGLAGLNVPKRFGGMGADLWTTARCVQELAKGAPACTLGFNMRLGVVGFFRGMWSEADQQRFFPQVARDGALLDGVYSEARAGVIGLPDTLARPVVGGWRVSGRKTWGTLSLAADFHTFNVTLTDP